MKLEAGRSLGSNAEGEAEVMAGFFRTVAVGYRGGVYIHPLELFWLGNVSISSDCLAYIPHWV